MDFTGIAQQVRGWRLRSSFVDQKMGNGQAYRMRPQPGRFRRLAGRKKTINGFGGRAPPGRQGGAKFGPIAVLSFDKIRIRCSKTKMKVFSRI